MKKRYKIFIAVLVAIVAAAIFTPPVQSHPMPKDTAKQERYFAKRCGEQSLKAIHACIHRAAIHWDVSYRDGLCIASRETGPRNCRNMDPNICNTFGSGACGLFQFMPRTWGATPYGHHSVFDAKWAALGWAWAYSGVGGAEWGPHHWDASA